MSPTDSNPERPKDNNNSLAETRTQPCWANPKFVFFVCRFCNRAYEFKKGLLKHKRELHRRLLPSYKRKIEAAKEKITSQVNSQKSGGKTTENQIQDEAEQQDKPKNRKNSEAKNDNETLETDANEASSNPSNLKRKVIEEIKEGEKPVNEPPYKLRKKAGQDDKDNVNIPKEKEQQQKPQNKEAEPNEQEQEAEEEKEIEENETTKSDQEEEDEVEEEESPIEERDVKVFPKKKPRPSEAEILMSAASDLLSPIGRRKASLNKDYKEPLPIKKKFIKRRGCVKKQTLGTKKRSPKKR